MRSSDLSGGLSGDGILSVIISSEHGLDLGEVGGVRDEVGELLAHALLSELVETVKLGPELLLSGGGGHLGEFDSAEIKSVKDGEGGLVARVTLEVCQLAGLSKDEQAEGRVVGHADELGEGRSVSLADGTSLTSLGESKLEDVLTVVLPDTLEVGLVWESRRHLVGKDHVFLLDDLGGELAKGLVLSLESLSALRGSGIHAEHDVGVLVGVGE